jgi:hypothetical protein
VDLFIISLPGIVGIKPALDRVNILMFSSSSKLLMAWLIFEVDIYNLSEDRVIDLNWQYH